MYICIYVCLIKLFSKDGDLVGGKGYVGLEALEVEYALFSK